jgi:two-component system cell cycle sensor histidine kinase/response regulator CckA
MADSGKVDEALRESEKKYRTLFENMAQGVFHQRSDGRLVDVNPAALEIFGLTRDQFLGKTSLDPHWRVITEEGSDLPGDRHPSMVALKTGKAVRNVVVGVYNNRIGAFRWVSTNAIPLFAAGEEAPCEVFVTLHDITGRKQAEQVMVSRMHLMQFADSHTMDELLQETLDEVGVLTDSPIGFYHFLEADQKTLSLQAWSTRTLREMCTAEGKGRHYDIDEAGVWVDCVREGRPVIHNDYASLPHRKGMPEGHARVVRELAVPVFREGRIVAILGVGNKPADYGEKDVEMVTRFADLAWDVASRKQAEAERENLILQLQKALVEVRVLRGILPICASCKKVRDDKGYWNQIEAYIRDHSEATFSHGICPECEKKLYPDVANEER